MKADMQKYVEISLIVYTLYVRKLDIQYTNVTHNLVIVYFPF